MIGALLSLILSLLLLHTHNNNILVSGALVSTGTRDIADILAQAFSVHVKEPIVGALLNKLLSCYNHNMCLLSAPTTLAEHIRQCEQVALLVDVVAEVAEESLFGDVNFVEVKMH